MSDNIIKDLVQKARNGDTVAFNTLYDMTSQTVYFICYSFLNNEEEAKDAMQETYVSVYMNLMSLEDETKFSAWTNKIAINTCKQMLRKKGQVTINYEEVSYEIPEENESFLPEEYILNKQKRKMVMDIMRNVLSPVQYQTVILHYFNGLKLSEIAEIMECPEGTVKYRLSIAKAKIKEGVLNYEIINHDKLYAHGTLPFLTSLLTAAAMDVPIPQIFPQIISTISSMFATGAAVAGGITTATESSAIVGTSSVGMVGTAGSAGIVSNGSASISTAVGAGAKVGLAAVKGKVIAGVIAAAVAITGAVAGIHIWNNNHQEKPAVTEEENIDIVQNVGDRVIYSDNTIELHLLSTEYVKDKNKSYLDMKCRIVNKSDVTMTMINNFFEFNGHCGQDNSMSAGNAPVLVKPGETEHIFKIYGFSVEGKEVWEDISHFSAFFNWGDEHVYDPGQEWTGHFVPVYETEFSFDLEESVHAYFKGCEWEGTPEVVYEDEYIVIRTDRILHQRDEVMNPNEYYMQYVYENKSDIPLLVETFYNDDYTIYTTQIMPSTYIIGQASIYYYELSPDEIQNEKEIRVRYRLGDMRKNNTYFIDEIEGEPSSLLYEISEQTFEPIFMGPKEDK